MIDNIFSRAHSSWTKNEGPLNHIVISSRVRLARNLAKIPMPPFQNESQSHTVLERTKKAVEAVRLAGNAELFFLRLSELPALEKQILLEKHLISPEHLEDKPNRGLAISADETISIMVNEEDHIRLQVLLPGLQLDKAWELADKFDNLLEEYLEFAFCEKKGYLTACPTNVGTGLRASVMVHIPALVMTRQASKIFHTLSQLGLAVRGLYGEGTESRGNIFQISNQITLGEKESEIVQNLSGVTRQIVDKEEEMRKILLKEMPLQLTDRVGRAYGILSNAAILSSEEALNLLSDLRLGVDLGLLKLKLKQENLTELMVLAQPGFLQKYAGKAMDPLERDATRARLFVEKLKQGGYS